MNAYCSLHGKTEQVGVNAYGFAVYACCQNDLPDAGLIPDACTRGRGYSGDETSEEKFDKPAE